MFRKSFNAEDMIQVVIGSTALTVPVAFSEETWKLSETLPTLNVFVLILLSLLFISLYSIQGIFQGQIKHRLSHYIFRVLIDYGVSLLVVFIVLCIANSK